MSYRDSDSIAKDVRGIMLDIEELKAKQLVGSDQIKVRETISEPISITTSTTSGWYTAYASAECIVTAPNILASNELITYCLAEVRKNDELVTNKDDTPFWWLGTLEPPAHNKVRYSLTVGEYATGDEPLPGSSTFQVRFHVFSSANVTLEVNS